MLPLHTKVRGPAYPPEGDYDIAGEVLDLFRVNTFFRNFEIKGPEDRTLIYGILFVSQCLGRLRPGMSLSDATRALNTLAMDHFALPGDPGFPLNNLYAAARDRVDQDLMRSYLLQFRQELALRLLARVYDEQSSASPNKHWLAFTRRRFMNMSLA